MKKKLFSLFLFTGSLFFILSDPAHGVPTRPTIYDPGTTNTTDGNFLVDWTNSSDTVGILCYEFQEALNSTFSSPTAWYPPASQSYYQFYNHTNGTFYYRVRAKSNTGVWGKWSRQTVDMVVDRDLTAPTTPGISDPGDKNYTASFLLDWDESTDASGIATYELQEAMNEDFGSATVFYMSASDTQFSFASHSDGVYYFRVRSQDNRGNWSDWSSPTVDIQIQLDLEPPSTPILSSPGTTLTEGNFTLDWTDSTDDVGIETYDLQEDTNPDFTSLPETHVYPTKSEYSFSNKSEGTYYYRVQAKDISGKWSTWSETQSVTVRLPVISNVQISQITDSSALVTWTTDTAVSSKIQRYGIIELHGESSSNLWSDSAFKFQGINYAPAEAHCLNGRECTENDINRDLIAFQDSHINLINLYNIGWSEIAHLEEFIFRRCQELGLKINVRLEAYDKTSFDWGESAADWIVNYYSMAIAYALQYPDAVAYYMLNMPFDDFELRDTYYQGFPSAERQRIFVKAVRDRLRTMDPNLNHKFFVNVGYGGGDLDPHTFISDLVDGISVHVYSTRYFPFPYCYDYAPDENDPEYILLNKDVYDYFLAKNYLEHRIEEFAIPMIIDQTGFCDITDFGAGKVATRKAKQLAIEKLAAYLKNDEQVAHGWSYFKDFDKFGVGGENASWGLIDTNIDEDASIKTNHSLTMSDLFHSVDYEVTIVAAGRESGPYFFRTLDPAPEENQRPQITLKRPAYGNAIAVDGRFTIQWEDEDPDSSALISLYYDLYDKAPLFGQDDRPELSKFQGTLIASGISEDDEADSFLWDVSNLDPGAYMIYAVIEDAAEGHEPEIDYSNGRVITTENSVTALFHPGSSEIVIDGIPDETVWNDVPWLELPQGTNPDESRAFVKWIWNFDYLYVALDVQDTQVETSSGSTPWDHDGISLTLFNGTIDNFTTLGQIPKARLTVDGSFSPPEIAHRLNLHEGALQLKGLTTLNNNSDTDEGFSGEMKFYMYDLRIMASIGDIIPLDIIFTDHDGNPGSSYDLAEFSKVALDGHPNDDLAGASLVLDEHILAKRRSGDITIDGVADELEWDRSEYFTVIQHPFINDATQVQVKALWDEEALYIVMDVSDTYIETSDLDWNSDSVTCTLSYQNILSKNRQDIAGTGEGTPLRAAALKGNSSLNDNSNQDVGYCVEMKILWSQIGYSATPDDTLSIDFLSVDHDQNPQQSHESPQTIFSKKSWDMDHNPDTAGRFLDLND